MPHLMALHRSEEIPSRPAKNRFGAQRKSASQLSGQTEPPLHLFSLLEIDESGPAMPACHPTAHMLAAVFSRPAQLEADAVMRPRCRRSLNGAHLAQLQFNPRPRVHFVSPRENLLPLLHVHTLRRLRPK